MNVALFGGSFNPPHLGHALVCAHVLSTEPVEELWMMPSAVHPFGKALAPFEDRAAMCRLVADAFGGRVRVTDVEQRLGGEGRTVDTLEHLARTQPEHRFSLVMGADLVAERAAWKSWERIAELARIVPVGRAGHGSDGGALELPAVSSTEVRERLARGESCVQLVPRRVLAYIAARGLYR